MHRPKVITDSGPSRSGIPEHGDHRFRGKPIDFRADAPAVDGLLDVRDLAFARELGVMDADQGEIVAAVTVMSQVSLLSSGAGPWSGRGAGQQENPQGGDRVREQVHAFRLD
jgi:hypothetical protein